MKMTMMKLMLKMTIPKTLKLTLHLSKVMQVRVKLKI